MLLQLPVLCPTITSHRLSRVRFSAGRSPHRRLPLKLVSSLGGDAWKKLVDLDPGNLTSPAKIQTLFLSLTTSY